jgi:uncharacterized LabA/DUF88 family protein
MTKRDHEVLNISKNAPKALTKTGVFDTIELQHPVLASASAGLFLWRRFMKVLIDGENFRHQVAAILLQHKKIANKNAYFRFDLNGFLEEVTGEKKNDANYYTTRIRQPHFKIPVKLQKNITTIGGSNRKWIADLTNQGLTIIKAGYLRIRESSACIHCGKKTLVLQEKGVDVRVATDLVLSGKQFKQIALVSSDSDLAPAIEATKKSGVYVYYVCYSAKLNRSIAALAHKTITFDDSQVLRHFKGKK